MITSDRQLHAAAQALRRLENALATPDSAPDDMDPRLQEAIRAGVESEVGILREQMAQYEAIRSGLVQDFTLDSLGDLGNALVLARVATGRTQRDLAGLLGLKQQQIQQYEATQYGSTSLRRAIAVAEALGLDVRLRIALPEQQAADRPIQTPLPASRESGSDATYGSWLIAVPSRDRSSPSSVSPVREERPHARPVAAGATSPIVEAQIEMTA